MKSNLISANIYEVFPRNHGAHGTIKDIVQSLANIAELGTDILWLMPFYPIGKKNRKGTLGSPYSIKDYRSIDPKLGTINDLKELIDKAHALDLKLIIDIVFNHTACDSLLVFEHPEWFFYNKSYKMDTKVPEWSDVYDLDYDNKLLWEYQIDTLKYWINIGVDGFRCDVAPLIPIPFWKFAKEKIDPDNKLIWLAESVEKSFTKYLNDKNFICHNDLELHSVFDISYDYNGFEYLEKYFNGEVPLKEYLNYLKEQIYLFPDDAVKLRFLENHDVQRIAERISNEEKLINLTVFSYLLPGAGLIYSGQEFKLGYLPDLFSADPINWKEGDQEFYNIFKQILKISKEIKTESDNFNLEILSDEFVKIRWESKKYQYSAQIYLGKSETQMILKSDVKGEIIFPSDKMENRSGIDSKLLPIITKTTK